MRWDFSSGIGVNTGAWPDETIRFILWTPRLDNEISSSYMGQLGFTSLIDFNVCTIHRDITFRLGRSTFTPPGEGAYYPSGVVPVNKHFTISMMFPRNARFAPSSVANNDNLDLDKDVLFYTIIPGEFAINYSFNTRMTYVDA